MVESLFVNLSLVVLLAVAISFFMRILRQPLLVGYIITGIIVGPYALDFIGSNEVFGTFSSIGIALLLFMVGLNLNLSVIKDVGKVSLLTGLGQIIFTSIIGFFIAKAFGFSNIVSIYVAVALTFSSTIIIMKLLSDTKNLDSLHGKIAVGFLIVQDLVAIIALMAISSLSQGGDLSSLIIQTFLKGFLAVVFIFLFSYLFFRKMTHFVSRSQEFLFLFSMGWCLALASVFFLLGFSIEVGALIAGVTLSMYPYHYEISSKMRPLRDFFIVLFFITLGSQMVFGDIAMYIWPIVVFSAFILIGNPLIVMIIMGLMGYTKRTGFFAGLAVAQISEFSLIMIALGINVGHLSSDILSMVTVIGLITIAGSTYLILYANQIYSFISRYLSIFERKEIRMKAKIKREYDTILFGYNRVGFNMLNSFNRIKRKYLVVDFNPDTISMLSRFRIPCVYGDGQDTYFLSELALDKIKILVSTIPDFQTNKVILSETSKVNKNAVVILRADDVRDAKELYRHGATYVLTPYFLGGEYVSKMIADFKVNGDLYKRERERHFKIMENVEKRDRKNSQFM